ncbi:MAG: hypothetical protein RLZZ211_1270 [Bacteroidota bacterium]|jgi:hypothetical protein
MNKINLNLAYKAIILIILFSILALLIIQSNENTDPVNKESSQIGRYKEVRIPIYNLNGEKISEDVKILDTETGLYIE